MRSNFTNYCFFCSFIDTILPRPPPTDRVINVFYLLTGVFVLTRCIVGGRGPIEIVKGAALMMFGFYLAGLGQQL